MSTDDTAITVQKYALKVTECAGLMKSSLNFPSRIFAGKS